MSPFAPRQDVIRGTKSDSVLGHETYFSISFSVGVMAFAQIS